MPQMSKLELYAAIRRDHRAGMKMRELERKHNVSWRTVRKAVDSVWPEPRKTAEAPSKLGSGPDLGERSRKLTMLFG
ncbi:hypothetical protein ACFC1L_34975 [Streptomyces sp. NPDC056210]|uniref:hypothetical protein n=1 Tax=Streptomyces sp. NPDC056210 TaxID=3345746 RepID=UPI0035E3241A